MKKIKQIMAFALALVLTLAMSITVFADDDSTTITVTNLSSGATVTYVQVIEPDQTTATGWKFSSTDIATAYKNKLGVTDDQTAIWMLIKYKDSNATIPNTITTEANAEKINSALDAITYPDSSKLTVSNNTAAITATKAGVYAIKAVEDGYAYNPMAAYVGFGTYDTSNGKPGALQPATVNAKKTPLSVSKTDSNGMDRVVEVGATITYTITTTVPYINEAVADASVKYEIKDEITGAKYVVDSNNKVSVTVTLNGTTESTPRTAEVTTDSATGKQSFTVDLKDIAKDRINNANRSLVLTYQATVTDTYVENSATPNDGSHTFTTVTNKLYTGSITMTKTGESDAKLADAKFIVYKKDSSDNKTYAIIDTTTGKVTGWTPTETNATKVTTDSNGTVTVAGLDDSETYYFKEVEAPKGYSVNTTDSPASWNTPTSTTPTFATGTASMTDTKLSSLPSTGGIGTTIFTVVGCLIMIVAAGMYFASRRRNAK